MNKYIITLLLIFLYCCNNLVITQKNEETKIAVIELISNESDSIKTIHKRGKVFFAIDPECPLCISYTNTINDLYSTFQDSLDFYAFLPSPVYSKEKTDLFIEKYHFNLPIIVDTNQIITSFLDARITPECFLLDNNLNTLYQGLIDNWIKELGRKGQNVNSRYLKNAIISQLKSDSILIKKTNAIGCVIERF